MAYNMIAFSGQIGQEQPLRAILEQAGFNPLFCRTGSETMETAKTEKADLVLLCGDMPDMDRLAWLRIFRQSDWGKDIAVVIASERRVEAEVVEAFHWGADDFIQQPCEPLEFAARLRAVLRRRYERQETFVEPVGLGPVALDPGRHECRVRGRLVRLRRREFELLEIMMRKAGRVLSRPYLLEAIWGMSRQADTRAVDVAISRLRQALGVRAGRWIETLPGFGYRYRNPE